jgi:hypothetical protein
MFEFALYAALARNSPEDEITSIVSPIPGAPWTADIAPENIHG